MVKQQNSKSFDVTNVNREVYLVKIPPYISQQWQNKQTDVEIGKFRIAQCPGIQKPDISLVIPNNPLKDGKKTIAKKYALDIKDISQSTSGISSKTVVQNADGTKSDIINLSMLGNVSQKLECKPLLDNYYMKLKQEEFQKSAVPVRPIIKIDLPVDQQKYETASQFKINAQQKKSKCKNLRMEKDKVVGLLFRAFAKHQYYKIPDLLKITKQPITYLKEILMEYCKYNNSKMPNKNTWELKSQYRDY